MSKVFDLKNHIALTSAPDIKDVCRPLEWLGITYFTYFKTFSDGSHIRLSNHAPWTEHYYKREFYNVIVKQVPSLNGYVLWSCLDEYPIFNEAAQYFNVDNGVVLVDRSGDTVERYFFGTTRDNEIIRRYYFFNVEFLNRFVFYFKDKASGILEEAISQKLYAPRIEPIVSDKDEAFYNNINVAKFLEETQIKRYCITIEGQDYYLPEREAQVLATLKKGFTAKEMAKKLDVTHRTVEKFKEKLRERLQTGPDPKNLQQALSYRILNTTNLLLDENLPTYLPKVRDEDS